MKSPDPEPVGPLNVRKIGHRVEVQLDDDGTPLVLGERLVEVRPGEWMTPLGAALSTAAFPGQEPDATEHAEPIGGHNVVMDNLAAWLTQIWDEEKRMAERTVSDVADLEIDNYGRLTAPSSWVLARNAADRQILDVHGVAWNAQVCTVCHHLTGDDLDVDNDAWPCQTVRLLALPYADRPGYREEWRP